MKTEVIIVRPTSSSFWWGVYGFYNKVGWEDLNLFYENEEKIGCICLNAKKYLRDGLPDLKNDLEEKEFIQAIEKYLPDNTCHYWYYYDDINDDDFREVIYNAPRNSKGVKPRFIELWHPNEEIDITTVKLAVKNFAEKFLEKKEYIIQIENSESLEESLESFKEYKKLFLDNGIIKISFADEVIEKLSLLWGKTEIEVFVKLKEYLK